MTFKTKSILDFGYLDSDKAVTNYQSVEYDCIRFDEATHFSQYQYEYLGSRLRGANPYPKQRKSSTNPGGEGHQYFKTRFIDPAPPNTEFTAPNGKTRLFIPSRVQDNKFLMAADPDYVKRLEELPEEQRKALLDGSWDLYEGQFFQEFTRSTHVCEPFPIPEHWRIYFTMDYGLDMLAAYWIALDDHDRGYVLREVYEPNLIISDAAKLIKSVTKEIGHEVYAHLAPPDLWNRRQETGRSVADIFAENGIRLTKSNNDRIDGWMSMKEWLAPFQDEQGIMVAKLRFFPGCVNAIRCIPAVQHSETKPNDISDKPHELTHAPDAIRYFTIYRSRGSRKTQPMSEEEMYQELEMRRFANNDIFEVYGQKGGGDIFDVYDSGTTWY